MDSNRKHLPSVVLVHGGFVDGSGWEGVYRLLRKDGFDVTIVQNPTLSLPGDVAATRRVLNQKSGPVILVGHSYGGVVITEAGNDPKVAALVYVTAFAPDTGESVQTLIANPPPGAPVPPILPPQDGFLFLDRAKFADSFAGDVSPEQAAFMADSQVPWGVEALAGAVSSPAWRTKPSWYLVATSDRMIPPPAQRSMAQRAGAMVAETPGSHSVYVSHPEAVASLIEQAAAAL
jgi:pimeloyl-ACP methyl ester carboxylesterase